MDYTLNKIKDIPEFMELEKEVYVVYGPNRIKKARIKAYHATIYVDSKLGGTSCLPFAARFSAYFSDDYFCNINWNIVPFEFIAENKKQAEEWAKVFPVECSDEDWYKAIGERPNLTKIFNALRNDNKEDEEDEEERQNSLENSELQTCCANISAIRDALIKCRDHKGLIGLEVENLQWMINGSGHDMPEDAPALENILKQLEIKWEQNNG